MTAVLAAAGRAVLGAALALAVLAWMAWTAYGPGGWWTLAWLAALFAVTGCAVLAWAALAPDPRQEGNDS